MNDQEENNFKILIEDYNHFKIVSYVLSLIFKPFNLKLSEGNIHNPTSLIAEAYSVYKDIYLNNFNNSLIFNQVFGIITEVRESNSLYTEDKKVFVKNILQITGNIGLSGLWQLKKEIDGFQEGYKLQWSYRPN